MLSTPAIRPRRRPTSRQAFSLVEMIAVMAIIVIMLSLLAPAVSSFNSTAGRNGAVNILMNTMEQARVAALESGRQVHIIFLRRIFPYQDAIMVVRDPDPTLPVASGSTAKYEPLSRWVKLPKNVLLHSLDKAGLDILSESLPPTGNGGFDRSLLPTPVVLESGENINVLTFNSYGGVSFPIIPAKLMLIVSEGIRGKGGNEALISANKAKAGGFEIISVRRYTGRASLEVTTL